MSNKIQITLTPEEISALSFKASLLGHSITRYIRHLIDKETYSFVESFPVYIASEQLELRAQKAIDDHKKGKTIELKDIDDLDKI